MTGEDIQRRLVDFARRWSLYGGTERAEAQTFLNELFACYGTDRVLTSRIHTDWAAKKSSTLRQDIRYTPSSAFETFPWPQATAAQREEIARAARELLAKRSALCAEQGIGLTTLYNRLDDGAFAELRSLHRALDLAVLDAYGWEPALLGDMRERNRRLYELNARIVAGQLPYEPF
jgi:hypothetical protein